MNAKETKKISWPITISWCLYDWACSSFSSIVITFIFATYFTTQVAANEIIGTYQWAYATSIAGLVIAFTSPLIGAIADYGGHHKIWMLAFSLIAIFCAALLWFAYPTIHYVYFILACVIVGTICYEIAQVFYNAFLPFIAPRRYIGRISGWGWGSGYLGGIAALTFALFFFIRNGTNLDAETAAPIRLCGPYVALWYGLFSIPCFFWLPNIAGKTSSVATAIRSGFKELMTTLRKLPQEKNIMGYLISHMLYADGLNTLFAFGGIFAAGTYGLSFNEILLFGISMNVTAGLGAILLGWMDDYWGAKPTVIFSLLCLTALGVPILLLHNKYIFWAFALSLCIFVGPVQSASRTLMVKLTMSKEMTAEMFGLYALSGKITAFIGPWILGTLTMRFGSQRIGMATILVFFILGVATLIPIQVPDAVSAWPKEGVD